MSQLNYNSSQWILMFVWECFWIVLFCYMIVMMFTKIEKSKFKTIVSQYNYTKEMTINTQVLWMLPITKNNIISINLRKICYAAITLVCLEAPLTKDTKELHKCHTFIWQEILNEEWRMKIQLPWLIYLHGAYKIVIICQLSDVQYSIERKKCKRKWGWTEEKWKRRFTWNASALWFMNIHFEKNNTAPCI